MWRVVVLSQRWLGNWPRPNRPLAPQRRFALTPAGLGEGIGFGKSRQNPLQETGILLVDYHTVGPVAGYQANRRGNNSQFEILRGPMPRLPDNIRN